MGTRFKQRFVVIRQVLTATKMANEAIGPFNSQDTADAHVGKQDNPREYYVLPLKELPKEER